MGDHERMEITEVLETLYGDGAWEIAKALTPEQEKERTQARIGLASNILGIAAGTQGVYAAARDPRLRPNAKPKEPGKHAAVKNTRMARVARSPKTAAALAGGALGLQAANLGGDFVTNAVLRREAKKGAVKKNWDDTPARRKGRLVKVTVEAAPKVAEQARPVMIETGRKVKDAGRKAKEFTFTAEGKVSKAFDEKRQVYGWVSITEIDGEPVVDRQGDYVSIEEIEKAAHEYLANSRRGGDMHDKSKHVSDLIESFIVTPEKKEALGMPPDTPTGWWCGFQVHDEDTWRKVRNGERPMFSIHGTGRRVNAELVA